MNRLLKYSFCKLGFHWFINYVVLYAHCSVWICHNCKKVITISGNLAYVETKQMTITDLRQWCLELSVRSLGKVPFGEPEGRTSPDEILEKYYLFPHPLPHLLSLFSYLNKFTHPIPKYYKIENERGEQ